MNLNNPSALFLRVGLSETTVPGFLRTRTKSEKQALLKRFKEEGKEENLNAICSNCVIDSRKCKKKDAANPHYGCTNKCCPMLHYWDMCTICIQELHQPIVQDPETRHAEVVTFQRIFSRLPEDTQHYISEYVPQVFSFVRSFGKILRSNGFGTIESHLKLPKSVWSKVRNELVQRRVVIRLDSQSNRAHICEKVKEVYKKTYTAQHKPIVEKDFWSHKPYSGNVFYHSENINALEAVHTILHI